MIRKTHPKKMGKRAITKAVAKNLDIVHTTVQRDFRTLVSEVEENPRQAADMLQVLCRYVELELNSLPNT